MSTCKISCLLDNPHLLLGLGFKFSKIMVVSFYRVDLNLLSRRISMWEHCPLLRILLFSRIRDSQPYLPPSSRQLGSESHYRLNSKRSVFFSALPHRITYWTLNWPPIAFGNIMEKFHSFLTMFFLFTKQILLYLFSLSTLYYLTFYKSHVSWLQAFELRIWGLDLANNPVVLFTAI